MANSVKEYLAKGDFSFANPSSVHSSGKRSRQIVNETRDYLFDLFELNEKEWSLFFHSGATEAINSFFKSFALAQISPGRKALGIASSVDHSAVYQQLAFYQLLGMNFELIDVDSNGEIVFSMLQKKLNTHLSAKALFNLTWVNNETGVVWDLDSLIGSLQKFDREIFIHVDAVQSIGKIKDWWKINQKAHAYTYSAHKFGGPKGIGFTFLRKDFPLFPLIQGGGQQAGLRSGTENPDGVHCIKLALEELKSTQNMNSLISMKNSIEKTLVEELGDSIEVVGHRAKLRNANTISLVHMKRTADILLTALDLAGLEVSSGSACSSGSVLPSRILLAMGYSESLAKSALRLSLPLIPSADYDKDEVAQRLKTVLARFRD